MKDGLEKYLTNEEKRLVPFHMPGHKYGAIFERTGRSDVLSRLLLHDTTEIPGTDDLFDPDGMILEVQKKYEAIYGAKRSYLQVNGASGALIASILAVVPRGCSAIVARNSHKSVFNALRLGGITPIYAIPSYIEEHGIAGPVEASEVEKLIKENPEAKAVIITSPNYYGVVSPLKEIADMAHEAGMILIVDQAHGAHHKPCEDAGIFMCGKATSAESQGADIVISSIHKTMASFTQSAVLNVCSDRVNLANLEDKLQIMETSSPSYILMAGLDINANIVEEQGKEIFAQWKEDLEWFYGEAEKIDGLTLMRSSDNFIMDESKINLSFAKAGMPGQALHKALLAKGIMPEMYAGNIVMCLTGIGQQRKDYEALIEALCQIRKELDPIAFCPNSGSEKQLLKQRVMKPLTEAYAEVDIKEAVGKTTYTQVIPYPPGIPLLCPGEVIEADDVDYIEVLLEEGREIYGITGRLVRICE